MAQRYQAADSNTSENEDTEPFIQHHQTSGYLKRSKQCVKCGHVIAVFGMFALFQTYFLRVNFNVALVAMVNFTEKPLNISQQNEADPDICPPPAFTNRSTLAELPGEFNWDASTEGILLGSFFYGYCISVIPAGYLSTHYSAKYLLFISLLVSSIINLFTPIVAKMDKPGMLIALRVVLGLAQGPAYPCTGALLSYWAAPLDRTAWCAFVTAGATLGTIIVQPLAGYLCTYGFDGGWPSVFYVSGLQGIVFCILWLFFVYDSPNSHPRISIEERVTLQRAIGLEETEEKVVIPWYSILTSSAVWAVFFTSICDNFGFFTLMTAVPVYLKEILRFDIEMDGALSSLPSISGFFGSLLTGFLVDAIRHRGAIDNTKIRKFFNTIGGIGPAVFMIGLAYVACDQVLAVCFLTLAAFINCTNSAGYIVSELEIAPRFYGLLNGIDTALSSVAGFVGPYIVAKITKGEPSKHSWQKVFYLMSFIYALSSIVFLFFGSAEEQSWAKQNDREIIDEFEVTEGETDIQEYKEETLNS